MNYPHELRRATIGVLGITAVALAAIQLAPVARTNPPAQTTVQWYSPQTQQLFSRACGNCHSNETNWPWYSYVAPSSWLTVMDVNSARQQWNLSELNKLESFRKSQLPNDIAQRIRNGTMPPTDYLLMHPEARLSDAEKQLLIQGMQNTLGK